MGNTSLTLLGNLRVRFSQLRSSVPWTIHRSVLEGNKVEYELTEHIYGTVEVYDLPANGSDTLHLGGRQPPMQPPPTPQNINDRQEVVAGHLEDAMVAVTEQIRKAHWGLQDTLRLA
jgi:hypothetical protein